MLITLDKSQSGGAHEKALLAPDVAKDPAAFNTSITTAEQSANLAAQRFVVGQSVFTDPDTLSRFSAELVREHVAAAAQAGGTKAPKVPPPPAAAKKAAVKAGVLPAS
jgi:hypothetical protein